MRDVIRLTDGVLRPSQLKHVTLGRYFRIRDSASAPSSLLVQCLQVVNAGTSVLTDEEAGLAGPHLDRAIIKVQTA